jgi:hypothetical protein
VRGHGPSVGREIRLAGVARAEMPLKLLAWVLAEAVARRVNENLVVHRLPDPPFLCRPIAHVEHTHTQTHGERGSAYERVCVHACVFM